MNLKTIQEKLAPKVQREYQMGFEHIRTERDRKQNQLAKVFDKNVKAGESQVRLIWKNIQLENALFLTDELDIKVLTNGGVLGKRIMDNINKVLKYDDEDMDLREMREDIINHNARFGLSATIIEGWDDEEKQPISDVINPLAIIPDPKNYKGSKMRFIGIERRVSEEYLNNVGFDKKQVEEAKGSVSMELQKYEQKNNSANNQNTLLDNEGMVDIYDHFTVFEGKKVLTTWAHDRSVLIRYIEIEPLTEAERLKPTKVKYPIQLHRRKPLFGSFYGVSIIDEVENEQDLITLLRNYQIINARINAIGTDTFVDSRLGIDIDMMSQSLPGGRNLPVANTQNIPLSQGIFTPNMPQPSQYTDVMIDKLRAEAEEISFSRQDFGQSQSGTQTKAEIQILQANANKILSWISSNYLRGYKEFWEDMYACYAKNMGKGKKKISMWQKGNAVSLELSAKEFIADGKVSITIVSKAQETLENDKEFNKLTFIANLFLPNIQSEYAKNELLRLMGDKSNVRDFDSSKYIRKSIDEMDAEANLELLNENIEVPAPKMGQDPDTYLDIYKQAMDNEASRKVIQQYEEYTMMMKQEKEAMGILQQGQGNEQAQNMAQNNINQESQNNIQL